MKGVKLIAALLVSAVALVGVARSQGHAQDTLTPTWSCAAWQQGFPGMMGTGRGDMMTGWSSSGAMWSMMGNSGMMAAYPSADAQPISLAAAQTKLDDYAAACGSGVTVAAVEVFARNYTARLVDASGANLMEVLVDRYTGAVYPEPGPTMMWNTRSGLAVASGTAAYDMASAQNQAATFLTSYAPNMSVSNGQAFPGYFTFDYGDDHIQGMLSVNAVTGAIWVHTWHGPTLVGHDADHD